MCCCLVRCTGASQPTHTPSASLRVYGFMSPGVRGSTWSDSSRDGANTCLLPRLTTQRRSLRPRLQLCPRPKLTSLRCRPVQLSDPRLSAVILHILDYLHASWLLAWGCHSRGLYLVLSPSCPRPRLGRSRGADAHGPYHLEEQDDVLDPRADARMARPTSGG